MILYCTNHNQDTRNTDVNVIVFDNIERFIAHDEIYNKDLDTIRKDITSYCKYIYGKNKQIGLFKFILALRTNTARMCGVKLDAADELPSDLNISGWFLLDDIIKSRIKWFNEKRVPLMEYDTINRIICDLRTCKTHELTGLQLFIDPLFNENKRLIFDFIAGIVEKSTNRKYMEQYDKLWSENTSVSRFAARSIIRGLIYQELDKHDNLFKHLKIYAENDKSSESSEIDYGLSYVRKILTILYNNKKNDMTLEDVIGMICLKKDKIQEYWNSVMPERNKDNITEVLFYMNSYNRRDNDWVQFIDMQMSGEQQSISIKDQTQLRDLLDKKLKAFSLKIMPAGETYLRYIVASFEFFSYRYSTEDYKPLFMLIPSIDDLQEKKSITDFECYQIIKNTQEHANNCMANIKRNTDIPIRLKESGEPKKHAERIIAQHQGFIDQFIFYLRNRYLEDGLNEIGRSNLRKLVGACKELKDKYKEG